MALADLITCGTGGSWLRRPCQSVSVTDMVAQMILRVAVTAYDCAKRFQGKSWPAVTKFRETHSEAIQDFCDRHEIEAILGHALLPTIDLTSWLSPFSAKLRRLHQYYSRRHKGNYLMSPEKFHTLCNECHLELSIASCVEICILTQENELEQFMHEFVSHAEVRQLFAIDYPDFERIIGCLAITSCTQASAVEELRRAVTEVCTNLVMHGPSAASTSAAQTSRRSKSARVGAASESRVKVRWKSNKSRAPSTDPDGARVRRRSAPASQMTDIRLGRSAADMMADLDANVNTTIRRRYSTMPS
eukprot:TRINITY_DN1206_c0_g1_i1.p1 TRINITY_DN1206_c0_g1~~TRINITY_DN1206_c0_g1_i1.p1  ORF type:complete len:303 (-),score=31.85 TRINITY_DN1206_c0_g1_i1:383-1291(-)